MSCDVITQIERVYKAYNDLTARCCSGLTPLVADQCALPAVMTAYRSVRDLIDNPTAACQTLTADESASDPGDPEQCLTGDWLERCALWIEGMTCGSPTCIDLSDIMARNVTPRDDMPSYPGGPCSIDVFSYYPVITGTFLLNNPFKSNPARLIVSQPVLCDDNFDVDGVLMAEVCTGPITLMPGFVIAEYVEPNGVIRITVIDTFRVISGFEEGSIVCWQKL